MTVAKWSSLKRVASRSGSCSRSSRLLDDGELPLDETEGAQREVDEGARGRCAGAVRQRARWRSASSARSRSRSSAIVWRWPMRCLRSPSRGASRSCEGEGVRVQGVDGAYDLGELVVAAGEPDRFLGGRVRRRARAEPMRSTASGRVRVRAMAVATPTASEHQGAEDGDPDLQRGDVVVAQQGEVLGAPVVEGGLGAAHQVDAGGERRAEPSSRWCRPRCRRAWAGR